MYYFILINGDLMEYLIVLFRVLVFYISIVFGCYYLKDKKLNKLSTLNLVTIFLIMQLIVNNLINTTSSMFLTITAIILIIMLQIAASFILPKLDNISDINNKINLKEVFFKKYKSLVKEKESNYPFVVVLNGKINEDVLTSINKTKKWLFDQLQKEYIEIEEIFYAFYTNNNLYIITRENPV